MVLTDFRTLTIDTVPLPEGLAFMVANTEVKHTLVDSEYNERRERCEQAAAAFARILRAADQGPPGRDVGGDDLVPRPARPGHLEAGRSSHRRECPGPGRHRRLAGRKDGRVRPPHVRVPRKLPDPV
ncbi:MAG: hypothetical protein MZV70_69145 [Desulfobacterales bacterium]|nr:hypothetical protein [Desulfobacterales bacterium]